MLVTHTLVLDTHTHIKTHLTQRGEVSSLVEREIAAVAGWKLPSISTYCEIVCVCVGREAPSRKPDDDTQVF